MTLYVLSPVQKPVHGDLINWSEISGPNHRALPASQYIPSWQAAFGQEVTKEGGLESLATPCRSIFSFLYALSVLFQDIVGHSF